MVLLDDIPDPQLGLVLVMLSVSFIVNVSVSQRVSEDKMASTARKLALESLSSGRGRANRTVGHPWQRKFSKESGFSPRNP